MRHFGIAIILLGLASIGHADDEATSVDRFVVAEGRDLMDIKMHGRWLVYHEGRGGKFIYDLEARQPYDKVRQYHRIPYGLNEHFMFDYDPAQASGWFYRFKEKSRRGFPSKRFGELKDMWISGKWMVYRRTSLESAGPDRRDKLIHTTMGGGWEMTTLSSQFDPDSVAVGGDVAIWVGTEPGSEGIYLADASAPQPSGKRVIEVQGRLKPDTDGKQIVWFDQKSAYHYDIATGERRDLLEDRLNRTCTAVRVDGPWFVWTDSDWQLLARHMKTNQVVNLSNSEDTGAIELIDVSQGMVVWKSADTLNAAKLPEK